MDNVPDAHTNELPESDIEIIVGLKKYVDEATLLLGRMDWFSKGPEDNHKFLRALIDCTPEEEKFVLSFNKVCADARKVIEKYEAKTLVPGEAEKVQTELKNFTEGIFEEMCASEECFEEFQCDMNRKKP